MGSSSPSAVSVLHVAGTQSDGQRTTELLHSQPAFDVRTVNTVMEAKQCLSNAVNICCLLLTHNGTVDGVAAVRSIREEYPELPIVLYPTDGSESLAISALSAGATEYIEQAKDDAHGEALAQTVRKAIDSQWLGMTLQERLKELQAIQSVASLLAKPGDKSVTELLESVTPKITRAFRYPDITEVKLIVGETTVTSEGYSPTDWTLQARTLTANSTEIIIEVVYTEHRADADEGPFLSEERELLDTLVTLLRGCFERREYLTELEDSEKLFRDLAENLNEVVWITDLLKDKILYVNPAYETVWGRSVESLYADPLSFVEVVHPDDRERVENALEDQQQGNGYDEEYRIIQPNGHIKWIHDRAVPVRDESGETYRIVGLAEDITSRKEREQQVMVLNRVLRHNLRNEVNAIQAYAELIADRTDGELAAYAEKIKTVATRLATISNKNRTFADQLFEQATSEPVALGELLTDVVSEFRATYPDADILLTETGTENVQTVPQIELAVSELLENAIRHTDKNPPVVEITVTVDTEIEIEIRDNGSGIPREEWEVLGSDELPLFHGSGLGLWIAHWVVTNAEGSLSLEKSSGDGSTVRVMVPKTE